MSALTGVQAQTTCPSDAKNDTLMSHNPGMYLSFQYMEQQLMQQHGLDPSQRTNEVYNLPVVVHVIHNGESYGSSVNITDEQIFSAIAAMNNDFRHIAGTNGDGAGPDIGVEFCLAVRDPNGAPTNGINRVNGSAVPLYSTLGISGSGSSAASESAVKALSTWPRASYVNIWVVSEIDGNDGGSGIQGYAYFPFNSPVDGIVILYNAFGTTGNLKSYTNMNRTITHEMGHYLGLYHTFNGTSSCSVESDCNTAGDRVCDTPVTIQNASCSNPACSGTQQVQNYLDYTQQTCQNMFSEGQKLRMRTTLETQRTSMITSLGCMPVYNTDVGITAVTSPIGTICPGATSPKVNLTNFGSNTLTSVTIQSNIDGVGSTNFNWTGSLASGSSVIVTLNSITPTSGAHTFYAWTTNPNGTSDQNTSNNQSTGAFTATSGASATLNVILDYFGAETTWDVKNSSGSVMVSGGPYVNSQQGLSNLTTICLAAGCYTLNMYDAYGDGQGFTNGSFSLTDANNAVLASGTGNWGSTVANPFCIVDPAPGGSAPVASFTIQDNTLCKNIENDYTNTSTNTPTGYSWTFQGGTPATSTAASPQNVTYANAGTYSVTLTATNAFGSNTYVCTNCITVYNDPGLTLTGSNPGCNLATTGSITSSATGTSPYTYSWNTGATTPNLTGVGAGTYTNTVTDGNGCTKQTSTTLTSPSAITITGTVTNPLCGGVNNGSITVSASGGTGTKTFTWSNGATGATISNLAAGSYTVTATDANGCIKTQAYTIVSPAAIVISGTATNMVCAGVNNGSITVSATGGTGTKTYGWSNGASGTTASNLDVGSYTVTVSDANGCIQTQSYTITSPTAIVISGSATNATCNLNNGSISVSATGGTGSKTFTWSNGATGASISNLAVGSYTATATDASGCTTSQQFTVTSSSSIVITGTPTNPTCAGTSDGTITVSATGGTGSQTFAWSNGATGATVNNIGSGSYTVTATDAAGCTQAQSYTLVSPSVISITGTAVGTTCAGLNNGSIGVSATGGTGSKTFAWSNGAAGGNITNLASGSYTVTATDANGCTQTQSYTVNTPSAIVISGTESNIACAGVNTGSISVSATGGTGNKTFSWSNGATGTTISNLAAGNYTVTATDANSCAETQLYTITAPSLIVITGTATNATCAGINNGSIAVSATGGTGNKTFTWSNGATGATISNLSAGNYTVTATDANNCTKTQLYTITAPTAVVITGAATNVTCAGNNDGSITVSATGGTGSTTFSWSNGATGTTVSNLAAGNYTVTATDVSSCTQTQSYSITAPGAIVITGTATNATCAGTNNGSITVTAAGGTGSKTYMWSNGATGSTVSNLAEGNYTVTATDANNCIQSQSYTITIPAAIVITGTVTNILCAGVNNGSVAVSASGGTGNKTFTWSNGATGTTISNLAAGNFTATATDANGCTQTQTFTISTPTAITITGTTTNSTCIATNSGSVTVSATGGTGNKTFAWSNGATGPTVSNLVPGSYTVVATDANSCTKTQAFTVGSNSSIVITGTTTNPTCSAGTNGSIAVSATGGTGNKTFSWSNGATTATISDLIEGFYTVTATDEAGCSQAQSYTLTAPTAISIIGSANNITCIELTNGSISVSATGGTGNKTFLWSNGASGASISNLAAGSYSVTATDANGCNQTQSYTVTAPTAITITGTATNALCVGANNGSITVSATGGTGNKTFSWSNGATGTTISNLASGSYTATATDANGCTQTQSYSITAPTTIVITGTPVNPSCAGVNNGSISVSASGGTGNKTFLWSNGVIGSIITNLPNGPISVTATDANGCTQTQSFTITTPNPIIITGIATNASCNNIGNGNITVTASGGTGNKTFIWSNGTIGSTVTGLVAGTYSVIASDANGCTQTQSYTITAPAAIAITGTITHVTCNLEANGSISVAATGGTGNKTFTWNNGATGAVISSLAAGTYICTASDANNCTATQNFVVTAPNVLAANLLDFDIACSSVYGSAQVSPNGGTAPYTVNWSNGATGNTTSNLIAGNYDVVVNDANACSVIVHFSITQSDNLTVYTSTTDVTCNGLSNGSISVTVNGGDNNYNYIWSNGSAASQLSGLNSGTYGVIVTDGEGCQGSAESVITEPMALSVAIEIENVSCSGLQDGIANATVTGGNSPYTFNWNNGESTQSINDLNSGSVSVNVVDNNGCTASAISNIVEPDAIEVDIIILSAETCIGNDGSSMVTVAGGTPQYNILWSNGTNDDMISGVTAGSYGLTVTDANGCILNITVYIPYSCNAGVPVTQLINTDCNAVNIPLTAILTCEPVVGATQYRWRFSTPAGTIIGEEYTTSNTCNVDLIPGVSQATMYMVGVKALVDESWGAFGQICSITTMIPNVILPQLNNESCGTTLNAWETTLTALEFPGVMNYQWHITGNDYDWLTYTVSNVLIIDSVMQLQTGQTYAVQMRCAIGAGQFTDWGPICNFTLSLITGVEEFTTNNGSMHIYPNPGDGTSVKLDLTQLKDVHTISDFSVYSTTGKLIETFSINYHPGSSKLIEHDFDKQLASGLYVLHYKLNGRTQEKKLIVR